MILFGNPLSNVSIYFINYLPLSARSPYFFASCHFLLKFSFSVHVDTNETADFPLHLNRFLHVLFVSKRKAGEESFILMN